MPDNRLAERACFFAQVDVIHPGAQTPRRVWGKDLSDTGMFLQTSHPFRVGDKIALRFDVEGREVKVAAAEVAWVRPFEPISVDGQMAGVGIRFTSVETDARTAIRAYVRKDGGVDDEGRETWVSVPPMSDGPRIATLPPSTLTMPPIGASSPITAEMYSLPPFSLPPLNVSLPPDAPSNLPQEARVFSGFSALDVPAPPPLAPADHEHPLSGWRFAPDPVNDTQPERPAGLSLRFSDEGPDRAASHGPHGAAAQFSVDSTPPRQPGVLGDGEAVPHQAVLSSLEQAFTDGAIALQDLPHVEERLPHPQAKRMPAMPIAVALLGVGTALGALYGVMSGGTPPAHDIVAEAPIVEVAAPVVAEAPPQPVAVAEAQLRTANPPLAAIVDVAPARAGVARAGDGLLPRRPTTAPPAPAVVMATAPPPAAARAPAPAPKVAATAPPTAPVAARNRVGVPFPEGTVQKVFTLAAPTRVVVDVKTAGAAPKVDAIHGAGITRLRTGTPQPGTVRLVVELADAQAPKTPKAQLTGGNLVVTW